MQEHEKSMHDHEIQSISKDDEELDDSKKELIVADEVVADTVVQALSLKALWKKKNILRVKPINVQALAAMQRVDKGKDIAQSTDDDALNNIMPYMEEGGSTLNLSSLKHFRTTELLKILKAKFKWVATTTDKLRLPPHPQLSDFEPPLSEQKRKRRAKIIKEVFVSEDTVVDGMHKNLSLL
nr:hypothetical protein [Tanacetum cinerariifolium]